MKSYLFTFIILIICCPLFLQAEVSKHKSFEGELLDNAAYRYVLNHQFEKSELYHLDVNALRKHIESEDYDDQIRLKLGDSHDWDLTLFEYDIRSENYKLRIATANGDKELPRPENTTYRGYVNNNNGGYIRLSITDDFIIGMFVVDGEEYYIESVNNFIEGATRKEVVLYKGTDVKENAPFKCGVTEAESEKQRLLNQKRNKGFDAKSAVCQDLELVMAADYGVYTARNNSVANVTNYQIAVLNLTQGDYTTVFELDFLLVEQYVSTCEDCDPWDMSIINSSDVLSDFRGWGNSGGFTSSYDLAEYWTARNPDGGVLGIAYLSGTCGSFRYNVIWYQTVFFNIQLAREVVSHEIGHNLSAPHDPDDPGQAWIMEPFANASAVTWSPSSISDISSFINIANCLDACETPECEAVVDFEIDQKNSNNLELSWVDSGDDYEIRYRLQGNSTWTNTFNGLSSPYVLTGLNPCSIYEVQIRTLCDNGSYGPPTTVVSETALIEINSFSASPNIICDGGTLNLNANISDSGLTPGVDYTIEISGPGGTINSNSGSVVVDYNDTSGDANPPTISLTGGTTLIWNCNQPYVDPGYSASDNFNGTTIDLTPDVVTNPAVVCVTQAGTYAQTYQVEDASGNVTTLIRYVIVLGDCDTPCEVPAPVGGTQCTKERQYTVELVCLGSGITITQALLVDVSPPITVTVLNENTCEVAIAPACNDWQVTFNDGQGNSGAGNSYNTTDFGTTNGTVTFTVFNPEAPNACQFEQFDVDFNCGNCADLEGQFCDDGNECTTGDVYDDSCNCEGTVLPVDCEGFCGGAAVEGSPCDDGNECTVDDAYNSNCQCVGTFVGDPDCEGTCGGSVTAGSPCDDGNTCTTDDTWDEFCNCIGTVLPEDCFGVCGGSDIPGAPCDDNDPNTENDMLTTECMCEGTPIADCEGTPGGSAVPGTSCDDNNANTINDVYDADCNCVGELQGCTDPEACNFNPNAVGDDGSCIQPNGCADSAACNFDPNATCDDGSCVYETACNTDCQLGDIEIWDANTCSCVVDIPTVFGCIDMTACNFDDTANCDDGSCIYETTCNTDCTQGQIEAWNSETCQCEPTGGEISGCTDPAACNFDPTANCDDNSCIYETTCNQDCQLGDIEVWDANTCSCVVDIPTVFGCIDMTACNFDDTANCDDGSCIYETACNQDCLLGDLEVWDTNTCSCVVDVVTIYGCTDAAACNFEPTANCDDSSCQFPDGCTDPNFCEYDPSALCDDGSCITPNDDPGTCNTDICVGDTEVWNTGSCECITDIAQVLGCMDMNASNYNPAANCDNGSCIFDVPGCTDATADNFDPAANVNDGSCTYSGCTDPTAYNYNPQATTDDGSCIFASCVVDFTINDLSQGNNGGVSPYYYNTFEISVTNGAGPYNYAWESQGYVRNAVLGLGIVKVIFADNATWSVTITDANGCIAIISEDVFNGATNVNTTSIDIIDAEITPATAGFNNGAINIAVGGGNISGGDYCYEWSNGSATQDVYGLAHGWYSVTVCDNDCQAPMECTEGWYWIPRERAGGRGKLSVNDPFIKAYPNPFEQATNIEFAVPETVQTTIVVYALDGGKVLELFDGVIEGNTLQMIDFQAGPLNAGVYIVRMETANGAVQHHKLILTK